MVFRLVGFLYCIGSNGLKLIWIKIGFTDFSYFSQNCFGNDLLFDGVAGTDTCLGETLVGSTHEKQSIFTGYRRTI